MDAKNRKSQTAWTAALGLACLIAWPAAASAEFDYADYGAVLKAYVNDKGLVNYRELNAHPEKLNAFAKAMGNLTLEEYGAWNDKERIAFWINAYNAFTLQAIIQHYPIKSSFTASLRFPKNSIRQISGVWDKLEWAVTKDRKITLEYIEHQILRKKFNEPRIHMALVCASIGCPFLRNEPFTAARLDAQLKEQTERFLASNKGLLIDRDKGRVTVSPIFKWFGEDFGKTYAADQGFSGHNAQERAVLNFISKHTRPSSKKYLTTASYSLSYLDYDWSLNEQ